jgi:nickel/cobalt transporter (NiCoT) family protein
VLTSVERRRAAPLAGAVLALHVAGIALLLRYGLFGVGLTAYTLGLRHAFDADHIGAIDNATRKLMRERERPLSAGFWFSLGHSTVVFALGALVVLGVRGVGSAVRDGGSPLHHVTRLIGPLVSGTFLLAIGVLNLIALVELVRRRRESATAGGLLTRLYGRATRAVRRSWHMYPLGCLFGLGFDTATEVALLVLAGGAAAGGLPPAAIVCLPVLFAAGMCLLDTLDGAFMCVAYGWALEQPERRRFYNVVVTGLSVAVALLIGSFELAGVVGGFNVDLQLAGYATGGLFVATWAIALAVWRVRFSSR